MTAAKAAKAVPAKARKAPARAPRTRRGTTVKTPVSLKLLEGQRPGRDSGGREVAKALPFRRIAPTKPEMLSPFASEQWDHLVDELGRVDLLKPADGAALAMACEAYSRWKRATLDLEQLGEITVLTSQGQSAHPLLGIIERSSKEYRGWCAEFGLTPSAEQRVAIPEPADDGESEFA